jgi:hypothetical protein
MARRRKRPRVEGKMKKFLAVNIVVLSICLCCQRQKQIERTKDAGVEVIINHIEPYKIKGELGTPVLERIFSIDTEKEEMLKCGLTDIETFDVDPEGNIFIIQWQSKDNFVFKFSPEGHFLKSFVRFGQGPGELEYGGTILINPENEIMAKDPSKKKFLIYDREGRFLRETRLEKTYSLVPLRNGKYLVFWGENTLEWRKQFVGLCHSEFEDVKVLDTFQYPNALNVKSPVNRDMMIYRVSGDNIFIGNTAKRYEIHVYDLDGNLLRKIRKNFKPVAVSEEVKKAYFELLPKGDPITENFYFTEHWPPFRGLYADDKGRLFALTYEAGQKPGEFMYDIFNSEGTFIGRMSLANMKNLCRPDSFTVRAIKNHLYAIQEKDSGYKELVVYKMGWK